MFDSLAHDGVKRPGTREMTVMLAGLMALNAFAIDAMVPALPAIGRSLRIASENHRQLVIVAYFVGFASTQPFWGPLADRFGRKPVLGVGIALYILFALLCGFAGSFALLIAGRVAMGASAAVTRVLVVAMVRDLFEAEAMARVMSLVFMTFMLVPVLAPNIGQAILLVASWRAIFLVLAGYAIIMLAWSSWRLPETLHPEFRRSLQWRDKCGPRDAERAAVARLHDRDDDHLLGADRLHQLDPADRFRCVRRRQVHRPGLRLDRRPDGARLLGEQPDRRALRTEAGRT
ncbi:MAG: MFS transporter [Sphingomonas sp.]|nr:MFS transporter [Sphingomonas sp.]